MISLMQRAAGFFSPNSAPPTAMETRLQKLVAKRRADAVTKALGNISDNRPEIVSRPLYADSVYHSSDLWVETIPIEEMADDHP